MGDDNKLVFEFTSDHDVRTIRNNVIRIDKRIEATRQITRGPLRCFDCRHEFDGEVEVG